MIGDDRVRLAVTLHHTLQKHDRSCEIPPLADLGGEHRTEAAPPNPHRLEADVDAALGQQIFDLSKRERITHIHHHREPDHVGRAVEIDDTLI
jgi:hypothetical protein